MVEKIDAAMVKTLTKFISNTIDEMAIIVKVTYRPISKRFNFDFRVDDGDLTYGKVIKVELEEILFHKITYKKSIRDSVINSLIYTLVQKNVESEGSTPLLSLIK